MHIKFWEPLQNYQMLFHVLEGLLLSLIYLSIEYVST